MDCEKFEDTMLDELYGELDELTLAASKRHMGGCARCSALMAGLRATRKLVTLPVLAPSEGFESRLLSAVQAAETKPSLGFAQLISLAGRWAMRPQTAMAAVFLLTVGTSSVLFSRHAPRKESAPSNFMTVTENGAPAASAAAPVVNPDLPLDPGAAAAAHGTPVAANAPARAPAGGPTPTEDPTSSDRLFAPKAPSKHASGRASSFDDLSSTGGGGAPNEGSIGGMGRSAGFAPPPPPPPAAPPATPAAAPPAQVATAPNDESARYRQGDYPSQSVDGKNAAADPTTVLQAARLVRDGAGGCQGAVGRFDQVASGSWGSGNGYDATLEGAQCYAQLGQSDSARSRYQRLLTVPAYAARAQAAINALGPPMMATRKATAKPVAAAPKALDNTTPSASAGPPPALKPAAPTEK